MRTLESKFDLHHFQEIYYKITQSKFVYITSVYSYGMLRAMMFLEWNNSHSSISYFIISTNILSNFHKNNDG
jgi:hypothetical protein